MTATANRTVALPIGTDQAACGALLSTVCTTLPSTGDAAPYRPVMDNITPAVGAADHPDPAPAPATFSPGAHPAVPCGPAHPAPHARTVVTTTTDPIIDAPDDPAAWRRRMEALSEEQTDDSLRLMRLCRLTYACGYYYRCIRASEIDEFLDIALPVAERLATGDAKIVVYATTLFLPGDPQRTEALARQCLACTERGTNPSARLYGWIQLGRNDLGNSNGLNYLLRALQELRDGDSAGSYSEVYRYISEYYLEQLDYENALRYARRSLHHARHTSDARTEALAWRQIAYVCCETPDTAQRIDAGEAFAQALELYRGTILPDAADADTRYADRLYYMVTLVNVGVFAYEQADVATAGHCLHEALGIAERMRMAESVAFCYKQLGLIRRQLNDFGGALAYYRRAGEALRDNPNRTAESDHLTYELLLAQAEVYAQTGDYPDAARDYREGIEKYRSVFDADLLLHNQTLAAYYQNRRAEEELRRMETILRLKRRQGRFAAGVVLLLVLLLLSTLRTIRYRVRAAQQHGQRLRDEARKAELGRATAELAVRLRRQEAEALRCKLRQGSRLVALRDAVLDDLRRFFAEHEALAPYQSRIETTLLRQSRLEENLNDYRTGEQEAPHDFRQRLQEQANGRLTALELRYCRMIYQGMTTRQMAEALYVEPRTVRVTRHRLKKRFGLGPDQALDGFLHRMLSDQPPAA